MRALEAAGTAFYYVGDNARASTFYAGQLEVAEQLGDLHGAADARFNLLWTQDVAERAAHIDEQLERVGADYRALGDERGLARLAFLRGQRAFELGRREEAIATLEDAMRSYMKREDLSFASMTAGSLGVAYLDLGDRDAAIHWWINGVICLGQEMGDEVAMTVTMPIGAIAAIERGRPEAAVMMYRRT